MDDSNRDPERQPPSGLCGLSPMASTPRLYVLKRGRGSTTFYSVLLRVYHLQLAGEWKPVHTGSYGGHSSQSRVRSACQGLAKLDHGPAMVGGVPSSDAFSSSLKGISARALIKRSDCGNTGKDSVIEACAPTKNDWTWIHCSFSSLISTDTTPLYGESHLCTYPLA